MILSYDLIKQEDIAIPPPSKETAVNNQPQESDHPCDLSNDSSSPLKKAHSIASDISKKEDFFIQKDLLNMINSFSVNENEDLIQRQSINSLMGNNNNNNNNTSFNSEWNEKVIDIKKVPSILPQRERSFDDVGNGEDESRGGAEEEEGYECDDDDEGYDEDTYQQAYQSQKSMTSESVEKPFKGYEEPNYIKNNIMMMNSNVMSINKQVILNNYHTFDNYELAKWAYILSKDQKACLYLQSKLDNDPNIPELLYMNLKDKAIDLMFGGFSNYFMQKLIDKISLKQIEEIIVQIIQSNSFAILGLDPHGTRVIQKIIERIKRTNKLLGIITTALLQHINQFIIDSNANHIIIKYASIVNYPKNQVIYDYLVSNILQVSHDKNACCALQKCIEVANDSQKRELFESIGLNATSMISDDFGNYALQFIIPLCSDDILRQIVSSFLENADVFALNKYASNVIEKCLEYCQKELKAVIIKKFLNEQSIMNLLFNKYGNYVLQTILSHATEPFLSVIISFIEKYAKQLNSKKYGQKFLMKLRKSYPQLKVNDTSCNGYPYLNMSNWGNSSMIGEKDKRLSQANEDESDYGNGIQGKYAIPMSNVPSNPSLVMNYYSNHLSNAPYQYYNNPKTNQQANQGMDFPQPGQHNPQLKHFSKKACNQVASKQSYNPMNINIAVNNYYTSPVYNYYCFQNEQKHQTANSKQAY